MKKRLIVGVLFCVLFIALACGYFIFNNSNDKIVLKNEKTPSKMHTNALTMMYETETGSGEYMISNDSTWPQEGYTFNERLSGCENGSELSWDDERKAVILSTNVSDKCYVYFDKAITFTEYITTQVYTGTDGENGLYYHTSSLANSAADNSYRYAGANPNNYVCFGDDCSNEDNLYRIIGVFGSEVKLIKNTSYGNYAWDSGRDNTWNSSTKPDTSTKPDIRNTLNSTFLGTLNSTWQNKIATHAYKVGGMSYNNSYTAKQYYNTEVGSSSSSTTDSMKIGLMYVSDYGYAVSNSYWTEALYDYDNSTLKSNNWMYLGSNEWTISRSSIGSSNALAVVSSGYLIGSYNVNNSIAVRPVFYLESSVELSGGSGTQTDPYRIA